MKKENHHSYFEWLQLIITFSIPIAIVVYTILQDNRNSVISSNNRKQDINIADNQQKNIILRNCKKTINKLIEKYGIQLNGTPSASLAARFTIISALTQLDPSRRSIFDYAKIINITFK